MHCSPACRKRTRIGEGFHHRIEPPAAYVLLNLRLPAQYIGADLSTGHTLITLHEVAVLGVRRLVLVAADPHRAAPLVKDCLQEVGNRGLTAARRPRSCCPPAPGTRRARTGAGSRRRRPGPRGPDPEQVLDWRTRAARDHQVVFDHIDRYGETSAQRLFTRDFVADVQRLGHLNLGYTTWERS